MASFTETATLKVVDQSSAEIKKINAALRSLAKTAASLKDKTANIQIKTKGLDQAIKMMGGLEKQVKGLQNTKLKIVDSGNLLDAQRSIAGLRRRTPGVRIVDSGNLLDAQRAVNNLRNQARGSRLFGRRGRGGDDDDDDHDYGRHRRRRGPTGSQYVHSAAQGVSSGLGLGIPLGGHPALLALEVAAYAAAAALKKVAESAEKRDRARLQAAAGATPGQRRILEADMANRTKDRGPLPLTDTKRMELQTSLLGDVSGMTGEDRARAAVNVADYIEKEMIPRQFALSPGKSFEDVQEGARKLVQAMNLASSDIINKTDKYDPEGKLIGKRGEISQEGKRVAEAIQLAQSADPDLAPQLIKTTLANLKTSALRMDSTALAKVLMNAGQRGQRSANEAFRAQEAFTGTVDVKKFNNQLRDLGLLLNTTSDAKGNVKAGSGRAIDAELLQKNPYEWLDRNLQPKMEKALEEQAQKRFKKSGKESDREVTQADRVEWLSRFMAGMSSAAKQGVTDAMIGNEQADQQLRQANDAILKNNIPKAMEQSWVAQMQKVKTELENQSAAMGESAAAAMGLPDKLKLLSEAIKDPKGDAAKTLAKGALDSIVSVLKMTSLEVAAKALQGAGVDLTAAAYQLMGKTPPAKAGTPEAATDQDVAEEKAAKAEIADIEKQKANEHKIANNARANEAIRNRAAQAIIDFDRKQTELRQKAEAAAARIRKRQQDEMAKAAAAADISDEDPIVISEKANEKEREAAERRIMDRRKENARKDREMYAREQKRLSKLTPAQIEREKEAHRKKKATGAIVSEGPEAPPPKPEGPEKTTPEAVPNIMEEAAKAQQKAAELNDGAATKMTQAIPGLQTTAASFTTAFDTAPEKIGRGGTVAIDNMQAGAGSVGAAIAAAFVAGASGVRIGVDMSGVTQAKATDKGNLSETRAA